MSDRRKGIPEAFLEEGLKVASRAARAVLEDVQDADWLPDGSGFVVSHYVNGRYQLEFPIGKSVFETAGYVTHPRVSPDGQRVAFLEHPLRGDEIGRAHV